jgi:hypothetical protein
VKQASGSLLRSVLNVTQRRYAQKLVTPDQAAA